MTTSKKSQAVDYDNEIDLESVFERLMPDGSKNLQAICDYLYFGKGMQFAKPAHSVIYEKSPQDGKRFFAFDEENNLLHGRVDGVYPHDAQSEYPSCVIATNSRPFPQSQVAPARFVFLNEKLPVIQRATALMDLVHSDSALATDHILELLRSTTMDEKWIPYVVYAAEELRFANPTDQDLVWKRLLNIAFEFRNRNEAAFERVVFSAIRRVASLLPEDQASELLPLLENTGSVDTRLVGLHAIKTVFSVFPSKDNCNRLLANRVNELAIKFIDRDVLIPGENTAIAEASVVALACLKSDQLKPRLEQVARLRLGWFSKILRRSLTQVADQWDQSAAIAKQSIHELTTFLE